MFSFVRLYSPPRRGLLRRCHRRFVCAAQPLNHVTAPAALESKRMYVVLSDLHVKRETVFTCVQALKIAHAEALKRDAGIVFLGDFWHARGSLAVEPLNIILEELQHWSVPVVMIPGNHDLVSRNGNGVSLVPLATTLGAEACLLITKPTVCLDALFLPYMHETSRLKASLEQAKNSLEDISAVFCHVEVAGAKLADKIVSKPSSRSISPGDFPSKVPVYSGHLHRPHVVSGNVRYVGSPYEVSAAEEGQQKFLYVLDRKAGWAVTDSIPIRVGPRHITIRADEYSSLPTIEAGDRVTVETYSQSNDKMTRLVARLREKGTRVEIRLVPGGTSSGLPKGDGDANPLASTEPRISSDVLSNIDLFQEYAMIKNLDPTVTSSGKDILREVAGKTSTLTSSISGKDVFIEWDSVTLRGFGSFLKSTTYSLDRRGIVLITGRDCDNEGAVTGRTNGTGKTTLVMSALWAMTGRTDARPDGSVERGVSLEMIHDDTNECEVTVKLKIRGDRVMSEVLKMMSKEERQLSKLNVSDNGSIKESLNLQVTRTSSRPITSSKSRSYRQGLCFKVNDIDLTCLDVKETQSRIDRLVNGTLLPHTVFFGQHMGPGRGLVDSTDRTLKEHLAMVFPLDVWKAARSMSREKISSLHDVILTSEASLDAAKAVLFRLQAAESSARDQYNAFEAQREKTLTHIDEERNSFHARNSRSSEDSVAYSEMFPTTADQLSTTIEDCKHKLRQLEDYTGNALDSQRESTASALTLSKASLLAAEEVQSRITSLMLKGRDWEEERERKARDIRTYIESARKELKGMQSLADIDAKWSAASMEMRDCEEKFQELVMVNIDFKNDQSHASFSTEVSVVQESRKRVSAIQDERVRLETALHEVKARLLQSENVSLSSSDASGEEHGLLALSNPTSCETCLRPFDGELYVQARSQLEKEAAAIEEAVLKTEAQHKNEKISYEAAVRVLGAEVDEERRRLLDRKAKVSETFSILRSMRNTRSSLSREISEFEKKLNILYRDPNLYLNEIQEITATLRKATHSEPMGNIVNIVQENVAASREALSQAERQYEAVIAEVQAREILRTESVSRRRNLQDHIDDLLDVQKKYQSLESARNSAQQDVNPYMESLRRVRSELNAETSTFEKREQEFSKLKGSLNTFKSLDVAFGPRGVPSFVLEEGLLWLERLTSMYLDRLSAGELMLQIRAFSDYKSSNRVEGDNKEIISKKVFVRTGGALPVFRERTLRQLSGGQRRRCSLAFALAFADLAHERAGFRSSLIVMDEILQSLDEDGRRRISKILPALLDEKHSPRNTVLVVAQDEAPEIAGLAHGGIDIVSRKMDQSEVLLDSIDSALPYRR